MKTLKTLLLLAAVGVLLTTCTQTDGILADDTEISPRSSEKMVTVPFKVKYLGTYNYIGPSEECGEFPIYVNVIVDGDGTGTHLGRSTIHFDFCIDDEGNYSDPDAYIVAANGDILNVSVGGQVIQGRQDDHPEFVTSYWKDDPFVILGGTGRFEGASGGGTTDDYNSSEDSYSHHNWSGTITMKK